VLRTVRGIQYSHTVRQYRVSDGQSERRVRVGNGIARATSLDFLTGLHTAAFPAITDISGYLSRLKIPICVPLFEKSAHWGRLISR
jgi:hypothetical protein